MSVIQYFRCAALLLCVSFVACSRTPELQPLSADAVILAFGDSLTYGTGAAKGEDYPSSLEQLTDHRVINAGIPGEVSGAGLKRLPALLRQHRPALVILCHGGNDILRRQDLQLTRENIQRMIDLVRASGAEVVLVGVPQFGLFLSTAPFYTDLAERNGIPIDASALSDILKNPSLKSDQIHPNAAGYRRLAERLAELLAASGAVENIRHSSN
jgi:lysophospholipase L1-like esterase